MLNNMTFEVQLEKSDIQKKAQQRMTDAMSQNLKIPLGIILTSVELLNYSEKDPHKIKKLQMIQNGATHVNCIINDY